MTAPASPLKAPFPYFGGKSVAAPLIWERFGNTPNYVEPFAGSLAVLLARPHTPKIETINDLDGLLSNAWRAIRHDPDAVAYYADQPVVEVDLHARHITLVNARSELTARLEGDPDYYDAKLAGWWIWGACNKIGGGWCDGSGPWQSVDGRLVKVERQTAGISRSLPHLGNAGRGVSRELPHLGNAGAGDASPRIDRSLPYLASSGVGDTNARGVTRGLPHLGDAGKGDSLASIDPVSGVQQWMRDLSQRLRRTRITCGDWTRVLGDSVTTKHGVTAVLLDPPYDAENADNAVYGSEYDSSVAKAALAWAIENGNNPLLRIAYCGYDLTAPEGWTAVPWKARKGYQSVNDDGSHNGHREVILFSPHCLHLDPLAGTLWGDL